MCGFQSKWFCSCPSANGPKMIEFGCIWNGEYFTLRHNFCLNVCIRCWACDWDSIQSLIIINIFVRYFHHCLTIPQPLHWTVFVLHQRAWLRQRLQILIIWKAYIIYHIVCWMDGKFQEIKIVFHDYLLSSYIHTWYFCDIEPKQQIVSNIKHVLTRILPITKQMLTASQQFGLQI